MIGDEDGLGVGIEVFVKSGGGFKVDSGSGHCAERMVTLHLNLLLLFRVKGCFM